MLRSTLNKTTYIAAVLLVALAGCQRQSQEPPSVIGIPFAVPVSAIKQHLAPGAKPEQYPLIPMYGYKLQYANPDNWEVIVQDESAEELAEARIYSIYLGRNLGRSCSKSDTQAVVADLQKKYASSFPDSTVQALKNEEAYSFVAVDERRMLSATASCFIENLDVRFTYLDLDRFQYRKLPEVEAILKRAALEVKEYKTRVLK